MPVPAEGRDRGAGQPSYLLFKIVPIARTREWVFSAAPCTKNNHDNFARTEAGAKKIWSLDNKTSLKS